MIFLVQDFDTTAVALAVIATLPSLAASFFAYKVHQAIKTPSGTNIGTQVEDTNQVALANHYQLRLANGDRMREPPLRSADVMPRIKE